LQDPRVNIAGVRRADLLPLVDWLSEVDPIGWTGIGVT
jgi:hypothetical protein